jgi:MFS family permease
MSDARKPASRLYVVSLVGILCLVYTVSQFLRSSTGVIAPNLAADLGLQPEGLVILSGAFFLSFAVAQIPVGILLDRYGARITMIGSVGVAILGCFVFAAARSEAGLTLARVLMGLGCSAMLMGPLMIYRRWFPADRFAMLSGLQISIGTVGALMATAPLAFATELAGWRASFVGAGLVTLVLAIAMGFIARDVPPGHARPHRSTETLAQSLGGIAEVMRKRSVWPLFVMISCGYASFAAVQTLWASPYLADVHGLDLTARGNVLLGITGGQIVGLPACRLFDFLEPMDQVVLGAPRLVVKGIVLILDLVGKFLGLPGKLLPGLRTAFRRNQETDHDADEPPDHCACEDPFCKIVSFAHFVLRDHDSVFLGNGDRAAPTRGLVPRIMPVMA